MADIYPVETEQHKQHVRALYMEYLAYVLQMVQKEFGFHFEVAATVDRDMQELHKLSPPHGRLLLIQYNADIAGLGGLRKIGDGIGEIKRMYVRPGFQGKGLGRKILNALIEEARSIGYQRLRLDVGPYSVAARKLYETSGFIPIEPYPESEPPAALHENWTFMERFL